METSNDPPAQFWWLKQKKENANLVVPKLDLDISSSLADFLEKEQNILNSNQDYTDVGSIIEEINRVAAQSPLGPYDLNEVRNIEDIMKEAEKVYLESSKSFEQLSQRSKTSQNITDLHSKEESTPTKSVSPLPMDEESESYSQEFYSTDDESYSKMQSIPSPVSDIAPALTKKPEPEPKPKPEPETVKEPEPSPVIEVKEVIMDPGAAGDSSFNKVIIEEKFQTFIKLNEELEKKFEDELNDKKNLIKVLEEDNKKLREDFRILKHEFQQNSFLLEQTKAALSAKSLCSPEINLELEKTLEELKDSKEINTALQLQLDSISKTHHLLKNSHEDLLKNNKNLERKVAELDQTMSKYKGEILNLQSQRDKFLENEINLNKLLEIEKLQAKSIKLQNEKDAKCIQDLNRQIKEMERIIARKHPDSVSALIVAAKNDATDQNLTARKLLEDRIKTLEEEALNRDSQSSKIFLDIQEKFNQMKMKYESHIEDLELHVSDLKSQLKRRVDSFDVYTQTFYDEVKKDTATVAVQTVAEKEKPKGKKDKEETHLLATIRGLQADLSNKEKVLSKLQKEIDELKKTNRRLQKEREGSLRSLSSSGSAKEFRSYPEKLTTLQYKGDLEDELRQLRSERDKMRQQLYRMEEDYQALKTKRIEDLNALHQAHEREIATYVSNVTPLKEQLELQQVTIKTLQSQLCVAKEELEVLSVERVNLAKLTQAGDTTEVEALHKKIAFLEKRYEEREFRLRTIVHGLAQKNVMNRSCEQCAERQQQLIGYKLELDQLLASVRALK